MPRSRSARAFGPLLLAALAVACSGGGGKSATVLTGNVRTASATAQLERSPSLWRLVRSWWSGEAVAQVPGVSVAIENTSDTTSTDTQGFFRFDTERFGASTLLFGAPGVAARFSILLPAGGEVDLVDIDIVGSKVTVGEQRIQFQGPITGIDCSANLLQVLSGSLVAFRVRLVAGTSITDQSGAPLSCVQLGNGQASVAGTVGDNGDVTAVSLVVNPTSSETPTPENEVQGTIAALGCPTSLTVATASGNVTVNLSGSSTIKDENGMAIGCGDLRGGDAVDARGTLDSFGLAATEVDRVAPAATPTPSRTPTR
jgi:hypothetical protein